MNSKARITYRFDPTGKLAPAPVPSRSEGALEAERSGGSNERHSAAGPRSERTGLHEIRPAEGGGRLTESGPASAENIRTKVQGPAKRPEAAGSEGRNEAFDSRRMRDAGDTPFGEPVEFTTEFLPYISPFQDDVTALEQLIRGTEGAPEDEPEAGQERGGSAPAASRTKAEGQPANGQDRPKPHVPGIAQPEGKRKDGGSLQLDRNRIPGQSPAVDRGPMSDGSPHLERPASGAHELQAGDSGQHADLSETDDYYPYFDVYSNGFEREAPYGPEHSLPPFTGPIVDLGDEHDSKKLFIASARLKRRKGTQPVSSGHHPSKGPSWLKVAASVAGALATGALFGYLALALFAGEDVLPGAADGAAGGGQAAQSGEQRSPSGSSGSEPTASAGTGVDSTAEKAADKAEGGAAAAQSVKVDAQLYQLLQYGVFTNRESAGAAAEELRSKGLAASVAALDGGYRVYTGMSADRSGALGLAGLLPDVEVYIKEVAIPALTKVQFNGDADTLSDFAQTTQRLIQTLGELSQTQLEQDNPSPVGETATKAWTGLHEKWTTQLAPVRKGVAGEGAVAAADRLAQAINSAAVAMDSYNKKPSRSSMWTLQGSLLDAVFAEKELFERIGAL